MAYSDPIRVEVWDPSSGGATSDLDMLGDLLYTCVHAGASVSFVLPFSHADARAFWGDQVLPAVTSGSRRVLLARSCGVISGTVQLDLATPPNQPHRAEVKKLLVLPDARRRGIGRSLMHAMERQARDAQLSLLTLDTVTGSVAEQIYLSLGYVPAGIIPGYAFNYDSTKLEDATVMYKDLK